ncbi:MAG: hypothetical protein LBP89_10100 [Helicobacteraceae bacterium]|jgi:hypothetical protein|nr:hypothetical protein [Helicobacteraceae bacterium]
MMIKVEGSTFGSILDFFMELPEKVYNWIAEYLAYFAEGLSAFPIGKTVAGLVFYVAIIAFSYFLYRFALKHLLKWLLKPFNKLWDWLKEAYVKFKSRKPKLKPAKFNDKNFTLAQRETWDFLNRRFNLSKYEDDRTIGKEIKAIRSSINPKGQIKVDAAAAMYMLRNFARGSLVSEDGTVLVQPLSDDGDFVADLEIQLPENNEGKENLVKHEDGTI